MATQVKEPPKAVAERISKLVSRINAGEIKIPKFQRSFVWKPKNVITLLESIVSGYPIGSLLFWLTEQKLRSERDIEGFRLPSTPEKYPTSYVLDGQQRLTSIYGVLSWEGPASVSHILNVVYDLRDGNFKHPDGDVPAYQLPLNVILDFKKFNAFQRRLAELPDYEQLSAEAERINETFREYQIPVVTITERTLEEVCPIFERINSTGMKLTIFDLMVAATFDESFDLNDEVEKLRAALKPRGFDGIDRVTLLKTLAAVSGRSSKRASLLTLRKLTASDLKVALGAARSALERAIDFLRAEVGVMSNDFLPYDAQLIVLAKLLHLQAHPTPEQRRLIRSWFWLTSFQEYYRGASDTIIDGDIDRCSKIVENGEPLHPVKRIDASDLLDREFRKGSAVTHAFIALLATRRPLNLTNGSPLDVEGSLSWSNRREFHHLFPRAFLEAKGVDEGHQNVILNFSLLGSASNKLISARPPSEYFAQIAVTHGRETDRILTSNLIPPLAESGLLTDNFDDFLTARAIYVANYINSLTVLT